MRMRLSRSGDLPNIAAAGILWMICVMALTGCQSIAFWKDASPRQKYLGFKQDYEQVLTAAVTVKQACDIKPSDGCIRIVNNFRAVDTKLAALFLAADEVFIIGEDETKMDSYMNAIRITLAEFTSLVTEGENVTTSVSNSPGSAGGHVEDGNAADAATEGATGPPADGAEPDS